MSSLKCLSPSLNSYSALGSLSSRDKQSQLFLCSHSFLYILWVKKRKTHVIMKYWHDCSLRWTMSSWKVGLCHNAQHNDWHVADIPQMSAGLNWNLRLQDWTPSMLLLIAHVNSYHYSGLIEHHRRDVLDPLYRLITPPTKDHSMGGRALLTSPLLFFQLHSGFILLQILMGFCL